MGCTASRPEDGAFLTPSLSKRLPTLKRTARRAGGAVAPSPPTPPRATALTPAPSWPPPEHADPPDAPPGRLVWRSAVASAAGADPGGPKPNQDTHCSHDAWRGGPRAAPAAPRPGLYGVFDGHGPRGGAVSALAARKLPPALAAAAAAAGSPSPSLPAAAFAAAFDAVDAAARAGPAAACGVSGSTATLAVVAPSLDGRASATLTVAWVGDSRAVLARAPPGGTRRLSLGDRAPCPPGTLGGGDAGRPAPRAVDVTRDHKPGLPRERARLAAAGARVCPLADADGTPVGPDRVWLPSYWAPGLAMSRAIGDGLARRVGVVATPDAAVLPLGPRDAFLILATDGVWEFMSSQDAVDVVAAEATPAAGARALLAAARARWAAEEDGAVDDVTVCVVQFGCVRERGVGG